MPARRSLTAVLLLVVLWTAMWPLVAAVHANMAAEETVLCHQAGEAVMPGEAPRRMDGAPGGTVHCPLCLMAFLGAPMQAPRPAPVAWYVVATLAALPALSTPHDAQLSLPPSRAPPFLPA